MRNDSDPHRHNHQSVSADRLLQSWKEIAGYLGISVRRAQQWEKLCGLPVYREGIDKRGRIVAYTKELDLWREGRRSNGSDKGIPNGPHDMPDPPTDVTPQALLRVISFVSNHRRLVSVLILVGIALAFVFLIFARHFLVAGPPVKWKVEGHLLRFLDAEDGLCWALDYSKFGDLQPHARSFEAPVRDGSVWQMSGTMIEDFDGDGRSEVIVCGTVTHGGTDVLMCFSESGELRWKFVPGQPIKWRERRFKEYSFRWGLGPFALDGRKCLIVCAKEHDYFPCQLTLIDTGNGRIVQEYWHPGALLSPVVRDLDGDGRVELAMAAINNPGEGAGHSAFLILDIPFGEPRPGVRDQFGNPGGREAAYVMFPTVDVVGAKDEFDHVSLGIVSDSGKVRIVITPLGSGYRYEWLMYELNRNLEVVDFRTFDSFRERHRELERQRILDHPLTQAEIESWKVVKPFATAPDGNSPEVDALWPTFGKTRGQR